MQMTIQRRFCRRPGPLGPAERPYRALRLPPPRGGRVAGITEKVAAMSPKGRPA